MTQTRRNDGFTLIELLIVVAVIGIIGAIVVPGLLRARQSGNEASAIGSVRALNSAETTYAATCGGGGFASTLTALGLPPPGGVPFISPDLAVPGVAKSGYLVSLAVGGAPNGGTVILAAANTCNTAPTGSVADYFTSAVPTQVGSTGQRSFASDSRGAIYQMAGGTAVANPIPSGTQTLQ